MKTLHLLRHAKSSWKDTGLDDHERPLSKRGRRAAEALRADMRRAAIAPDIVLCSTALRARQTLDLVAPALKPPKVVLDRAIYDAGPARLLKYLAQLPEGADCALLIGHNPALHSLALTIADAASTARLPPADGKFPTGALASFRFSGPWRALAPHSAVLTAYVVPGEDGQ
ncbi:MAG TPA: histidine phosphatase family protein [Stellaceae bacterium]|nr:histidine phosphatase family protein [Stellaceae bacterium]